MKKLSLVLLGLILTQGCAYTHYRYGFLIPGAESKGDNQELSLTKASQWKAEVVEQTSGRKVKKELVEWQYSGALSGGKDGEFRASAPGQGLIRATFPVGGDKKTLVTRVMVTGKPEATPPPVLTLTTESPLVEIKPTLKPTPAPDEAETVIMQAYDQAGKGDYQAALASLDTVKDPAWQPKVKALRAEWGKMVADRTIEKAAKSLLDKDFSSALKQLEQLRGLPLNPKQQEQERLIRKRLKELL